MENFIFCAMDIIKCIDWNLLDIFSVNHNTEWRFAPANTLKVYI